MLVIIIIHSHHHDHASVIRVDLWKKTSIVAH